MTTDERVCIAICDLFDAMDNLGGREHEIRQAVKDLPRGNPDRLVYLSALRDLLDEAIEECEPDTISQRAMEAKAAMYFALCLTMFGILSMLCYAALRNLP